MSRGRRSIRRGVALCVAAVLGLGLAGCRVDLAAEPGVVAPQAIPQDVGESRVSLRVDDFGAIEPLLAALREGGCRIEEMELLHTDLEDVFVQVMKETR